MTAGEPPAHDPNPWELPAELLAKYAFERWLGHGATAVVYLARQTNLGRRVVVKVLKRPEQDLEERFLREAKILSTLRHQGIVHLLDYGESGNRLYMTSAYEEGKALSAILDERGHLGWRESLRLGRQVAEALAEAHGKLIIHRDVKPGNILIGVDGIAKLLDFGFSRMPGSTLTAAGEYIGTPAYSAPEHCHTGRCDAVSDLYSLGVVLYQCLTGENPFRGASTVESLQLQLSVRIDEFPAHAPPSPAELRQLVLQLLEKTPSDRPASAAQVVERLKSCLSGTPTGPGRVTGNTPVLRSGIAAVQPAGGEGSTGPGTARLSTDSSFYLAETMERRPGKAERPAPGRTGTGKREVESERLPWGGLLATLLVLGLTAGSWFALERGLTDRPVSAGDPAAAASGILNLAALSFETTPSGRVVAVSFESPQVVQARIEEEGGAISPWSGHGRSQRLQRVGATLGGRFSVTVRPPAGQTIRRGPFPGDCAGALRQEAVEADELTAFAVAIRAAIGKAAAAPREQAASVLLAALKPLSVTRKLAALMPYFASEASSSVRLPIAQRRHLVRLAECCSELWRAATFVRASGGDSGPLRALVPEGLSPYADPEGDGTPMATVECMPRGADASMPPCPPLGGAGLGASPMASATVDVPPQPLATGLSLEIEIEFASARRFTEVEISGEPESDSAPAGSKPAEPPMVESIFLQRDPSSPAGPGRFRLRLDPAFLACRRLRLLVRSGCMPAIGLDASAAQATFCRLGPARLLLLP